MDANVNIIYQELVRVAADGDITYYSDIAPLVGLDMNFPDDRNQISNILGEISRREYEGGRPLLSAVVILRNENIPGEGFFNLARGLELYDEDNDMKFWIQELRRVHDYWAKHQ